jgi:hypothetical protein
MVKISRIGTESAFMNREPTGSKTEGLLIKLYLRKNADGEGLASENPRWLQIGFAKKDCHFVAW